MTNDVADRLKMLAERGDGAANDAEILSLQWRDPSKANDDTGKPAWNDGAWIDGTVVLWKQTAAKDINGSPKYFLKLTDVTGDGLRASIKTGETAEGKGVYELREPNPEKEVKGLFFGSSPQYFYDDLLAAEPQPGDRITIAYKGKIQRTAEERKEGKRDYHSYSFLVTNAGPGAVDVEAETVEEDAGDIF